MYEQPTINHRRQDGKLKTKKQEDVMIRRCEEKDMVNR